MSVPRDEKGKLTDWTDVAQLDYRNAALRREMISSMQFWLRDYGIDGFRVDVAGFVPDEFWREALPALRRSVDRPILLLAEWGDRRMHRLGFDLSYSWDMYGRLKRVWKGEAADSLVMQELADADSLRPGGMRLRFTTNHDETGWDQPPVVLFGGAAGARAAFVAAAFLPGRPLLYNGQDVESPQKLRLFYRDSIVWSQPGAAGARAFYQRVVSLLRTDSAFITGAFRDVATTAERDVIAYQRGDAVVLVNARSHPVSVAVRGFPVALATDLLTDRQQRDSTVTLPAHGFVVLAHRTRRPNGK